MELKLKNENFVVGGAGSGFGKAIARGLAGEGANVLAVSRTESKMLDLQADYPDRVTIIPGDITDENIHKEILNWSSDHPLSGAVINAGGPPAGGFFEIDMDQWTKAWESVVRWKISGKV
jgi:3-oxoacyl-[acyl-carrier protein] reductase